MSLYWDPEFGVDTAQGLPIGIDLFYLINSVSYDSQNLSTFNQSLITAPEYLVSYDQLVNSLTSIPMFIQTENGWLIIDTVNDQPHILFYSSPNIINDSIVDTITFRVPTLSSRNLRKLDELQLPNFSDRVFQKIVNLQNNNYSFSAYDLYYPRSLPEFDYIQ